MSCPSILILMKVQHYGSANCPILYRLDILLFEKWSRWYVFFFPCQTYMLKFYMKKYGHATWKRTTIIANRTCVAALKRGSLTRKEKKCKVKTTKTYKNKQGKDCWMGSEHLKGTELLS